MVSNFYIIHNLAMDYLLTNKSEIEEQKTAKHIKKNPSRRIPFQF